MKNKDNNDNFKPFSSVVAPLFFFPLARIFFFTPSLAESNTISYLKNHFRCLCMLSFFYTSKNKNTLPERIFHSHRQGSHNWSPDQLLKKKIMQEMGLEPTRSCDHRHLKPARLPIPPLLHFCFATLAPLNKTYITR